MPIRSVKGQLPEEGTRQEFKHVLLRWLGTYHCGYCFADMEFDQVRSVARTADLVCNMCLSDPAKKEIVQRQMFWKENLAREAEYRRWDRESAYRRADSLRRERFGR